jgi:nitroreductase
MSEVIGPINDRRALRAFDSRAVPLDVQETLWEAFQLAPSQGNSQPARLLVARSPEVRERVFAGLSEGNRGWAGGAQLLLAAGAFPAHDHTPVNSDGSTREMWGFDAGLALASLLIQASAMGLVAHPMAGFDEVAVRAAFGAPPELRILAVVALGYPADPATLPEDLRAKETAPRRRLAREHVVAFDAWDERLTTSWRDLQKRP